MMIKKYLRREGGQIYKYARVTYHPSAESQKKINYELDKSLGWMPWEGYSIGEEKPRLQEIYRRPFNDFGR